MIIQKKAHTVEHTGTMAGEHNVLEVRDRENIIREDIAKQTN